MKKVINKTEREEIVIALVCAASTKSAQKIVDKLGVLRKELGTLIHNHWQDQFPGISSADQTALLQSGGANYLRFRPAIYTKDLSSKAGGVRTVGQFGLLSWRNGGEESDKVLRARLAFRTFRNCTGMNGVVIDGISNSYTSELAIAHSFPSIIAGTQPDYVYDDSTTVPDETDPVYNGRLLAMHTKIQALLVELRELLDASEDAYEKLHAVLLPVKTGQALAELMPEAVKHFPPSLTYVKPTQEIADPKAINDIRAKLKKGLPI